MDEPTFKVGDVVKLKPKTVKLAPKDVRNHRKATILAFLPDIQGGVVLDRHMGGFRYWNVEDLLPAASLGEGEAS
jgi:hypothetical protein